ncbi:MAG: PIN domain-containing protein [Bifidobacteriaceae bacterium]|nr:PIN domain-containing protein [Bifidobacteriaceae bacterium]
MTLLLDTMVLSDLGKARPHPVLARWAATVDFDQAFLSAVSLEELELGVLLKERRRAPDAPALRRWLETSVVETFAGRIIPVDAAVARRAAALHVARTRPANDARIAATAIVHSLTLATRNWADFEGLGLRLVNPYFEEPPDIRLDPGTGFPTFNAGHPTTWEDIQAAKDSE